jgi:hypothetical protein
MPAFTNGAIGRKPQRRRESPAAQRARDTGADNGAGDAERALLDAAVEFYGAAEAVIDFAGLDRPRLRYDVGGLEQVRDAMARLEAHVRRAHAAGLTPERIARIARLDDEIVALMLARDAGPVSPAGG